MTTILHLCNDYLGSKVYKGLYRAISESTDIKQIVFVPLRASTKGKANVEKQMPYLIHYSSELSIYHRVWFERKRSFLYQNLLTQVNMNNIDLVHATTLFSDGALAYDLFKQFNVPYIVTVRSTDISTFLKYRPDLYKLGLEIMINAKKIIFISKVLFKKTLEHRLLIRHQSSIVEKCSIIPNGIESFWLENRLKKKNVTATKLIYVGSLIERKNVLKLIASVLSLKAEAHDISLTIVGSSGKHEQKVLKLASKNPDTIKYLGRVDNKEKLRDILRQHDIFAMPSFNETFGLVYIEALSQGLPVIYSKGDGVDGLIARNMGESVDPFNINDIKEGILRSLKKYNHYDIPNNFLDGFRWEKIAETYLSIYND